MPKISVGMLTYNRPGTLNRAIDSILNQTLKDIELILVNNGSTLPAVSEICKKFTKDDKRVKLFNVYPNNIAKAYKTILDNSTGDFYTQMDDDDYCDLDILEFLYNLALKHDADISLCGSYRVINDKPTERYSFDKVMVMNKAEAMNQFLKREICSSAVWSKIFKREKVIANIGWTSHEKQGDADTVYKWFANADRVVAHGIPKYYQVRTESDDLYGYVGKHNLTPELLNNYLNIYNRRTQYLLERVPEIKERIIYSKWSFLISMYDKIYSYGLQGFDEHLQIMGDELKLNYDEFYSSHLIKDFEKENLKKYIQ